MATIGVINGMQTTLPRHFEKCRKVGVTFASVDDGDTFTAGPSAMCGAWESTTADTGEVHWVLTRSTGLFTADCAASGNVGTLWIFFGSSSDGN